MPFLIRMILTIIALIDEEYRHVCILFPFFSRNFLEFDSASKLVDITLKQRW